MALGDEALIDRGYLYDIATSCPHQDKMMTVKSAVIITDGYLRSDRNMPDNKYEREQFFPEQILQRALQVKLEAGEASFESDRTHILNSIVGQELNSTPPETHPKFDELNDTLRGRVAAGALNRGIKQGGEVLANYVGNSQLDAHCLLTHNCCCSCTQVFDAEDTQLGF